MKKSLIGASILLQAFGGAAMADERILSGEEVRSLVVGNTRTGFAECGQYFMYSREDGTQSLGCDFYSDSGKWWVEGDDFCTLWKNPKYGGKACGQIHKVGDEYHYYVDGQFYSKFMFMPGNPAGL